jgi:hypothetical protein
VNDVQAVELTGGDHQPHACELELAVHVANELAISRVGEDGNVQVERTDQSDSGTGDVGGIPHNGQAASTGVGRPSPT